jgi:hypothetical protein
VVERSTGWGNVLSRVKIGEFNHWYCWFQDGRRGCLGQLSSFVLYHWSTLGFIDKIYENGLGGSKIREQAVTSKNHVTPSWLEVSLLVNGELAEAVADVLARFAPDGVVIESTEISPDPEGEGRPTGPLRVLCYLPVDAQIEETRQRLEEALWYLGRIRPLPPPEYHPIQQVDWTEAWRQHYRPIEVGRLVIVPAWMEQPRPE